MSFLKNLPSHGYFTSIKSIPSKSTVLPNIPSYYGLNNTDPPSDQIIKTDSTNILIRSLTQKKKQGETSKQNKSQKSNFKLQENIDSNDEEVQPNVKKQKTESQDTNTHTLNSNYLQSILSTNNNNITTSTTTATHSTKVSKKIEKHTTALKNTQKSDDNDEYDKLYNDTNTMDDDSDTEYTVHTKKQTLKKTDNKKKKNRKRSRWRWWWLLLWIYYW